MTIVDHFSSPPHWSDLTVVPRAPLRSALSAILAGPVARRLHIRVQYPGGRLIGDPDPSAPVMRLNDPWAVHRRCAAEGPIGLGEAYQAGEWDTDDLTGLLTTMATHLTPPPWLLWLRRHYGQRGPAREDNSIENARHNVQHHYDLSNAFFSLFLDETMTYSSALFDVDGDADGKPMASDELLAEAQHRKIERVLDLAGVRAGTRLLEIGTGWGALAVAAARRGATVHTVTISPAQQRLARQRAVGAGEADAISVDLCDYRQLNRKYADGYDAIVSVEMFEAVGEKYWPVYWATLQRLLAPGGRIAAQVITTPHDRMLARRNKYTWIAKYIFPGGLIPSLEAVDSVLRTHTSLRVRHTSNFGAHYAETLRLWRDRLAAHEPEIRSLGFDHTFLRTWSLYLAYSEAGFRSGVLDVRHLVLERSA
jgi:cyclopropane-fatty-acyl-phospholipid synthase